MAKSKTKKTPKERVHRWTKRRRKHAQAQFFLAYIDTGCVTTAAQRIGVHRSVIYKWRSEDEEFATAWTETEDRVLAEKADLLVESSLQRAIHGYRKPLFHAGEPIMEIGPDGKATGRQAFVRSFSPALAIFMLTHLRPDKFTQKALEQFRAKTKDLEITFGTIPTNGQPPVDDKEFESD